MIQRLCGSTHISTGVAFKKCFHFLSTHAHLHIRLGYGLLKNLDPSRYLQCSSYSYSPQEVNPSELSLPLLAKVVAQHIYAAIQAAEKDCKPAIQSKTLIGHYHITHGHHKQSYQHNLVQWHSYSIIGVIGSH